MRPAGVIPGSEVARDASLEADACVIGSGAAGGVVAKELAEAGLSVVVLEEGGWFDKDDYGHFPPSETFRRVYRDGGTTIALGGIGSPSIALPLGRAVGGSTVVNGGVCFRTPRDVLEDWQRAGLPYDLDEIDHAFERVEDVLEVRPMREEVLGGNSRAFREGCRRLGLHVDVMKRNTPRCDGCCRCIFGCPDDRKNAIHLTYIPRALERGARVHAECRAEEILIERGRAAGVRASVVDAKGDRRASLVVRARAVVLAAGAIHTPLLLGRQRLGGPSGALGRNLAIHPSCRVLAEFDEPIDGHKGAFQGLFSSALDAIGIKMNGIFLPPGILGSTLPFVGGRARAALARYRHYGAFGVMVSDESVGRVRATPFGPAITYSIDPGDVVALARGVQAAARVWFAAGAKRVFPALRGLPILESERDLARIVPGRVRATDIELAAFHPMGTCRMSPDPRRGVVRPDFQHHSVDGLYLPDASWFPSSLRVNPQITIMAFATLAAREIARSLGADVSLGSLALASR
ncbi:GMC family oxidoreductase [bacterium]|nr:GMC family oxidoreductase [bacterium]